MASLVHQHNRAAHIFVDRLRLTAKVGIYPEEKHTPQPIEVSIDVWIDDLELAAKTDEIAHTIDYAAIALLTRHIVERQHHPLVESLAAQLAEAVLALDHAQQVRVRVQKLQCQPDSAGAGIELVRAHPTRWPLAPSALLPDQWPTSTQIGIVGGGPAALTAALWCHRLGYTPTLITPSDGLGGQLRLIHRPLVDVPGYHQRFSATLASELFAHVKHLQINRLAGRVVGTTIEQSHTVLHIVAEDDPHRASTTLNCTALIIAAGVRRRSLDVPGEREFTDRGLLHTASQNIDQFANKTVVVVGGGDAACENALMLAEAGATVCIVHRGQVLRARKQFTDPIKRHPRIRTLLNYRVTAFTGTTQLSNIELVADDGTAFTQRADAALVRIGWQPNTQWLPANCLTPRGYVAVDSHNGAVIGQSSWFAAGDIIAPACASIPTAFGSAATAAHSAANFLEKLTTSSQ